MSQYRLYVDPGGDKSTVSGQSDCTACTPRQHHACKRGPELEESLSWI